jgi:hypothetical protein
VHLLFSFGCGGGAGGVGGGGGGGGREVVENPLLVKHS